MSRLSKQDELLILQAGDEITHSHLNALSSKKESNFNLLSKMEKELLTKRYELDNYRRYSKNIAWDNPKKNVGKKLWNDYLKDKDEADLETAWQQLILQKNDQMVNHLTKKNFVNQSKFDRKQLLGKRKVERYVVSGKCKQDIHEKHNDVNKSEIEEAENLDFDEAELVANRRSAMHHNWLRSYPDVNQGDGLPWNQHADLPKKAIQKIYPKAVLKMQEDAFNKISTDIKRSMDNTILEKETNKLRAKDKYFVERSKRMQFNDYASSFEVESVKRSVATSAD